MKKILLALLLALPVQAQYAHRSNPGRLELAGGAVTSAGAANCPGTGCLTINTQSTATMIALITGTWSQTLQFSCSNDGWVTVVPISADTLTNGAMTGAPSTTTTANGTFIMPTYGFRECGVYATAFTSNTSQAIRLDSDPASILVAQDFGKDPCQSSAVPKSSVSISLAAAATTQLVAISGTQIVYVCNYSISTTGVTTATTVQFEYGTGALCATGLTALTGTFGQSLLTSAIVVVDASSGTIFKTAAGNALCVVVAGTTPSVQ